MKLFILILVILLIAMQFIPIDKTNPPINNSLKLKASNQVTNILQRSCYDCHSNETKWPDYSSVAPLSWVIAGHVNSGRKALNFSEWEDIDPKIKTKRLERAIKTVNNNMMPTPAYLKFHKEAILSDDDKKIIVEWFKKQLLNLKAK